MIIKHTGSMINWLGEWVCFVALRNIWISWQNQEYVPMFVQESAQSALGDCRVWRDSSVCSSVLQDLGHSLRNPSLEQGEPIIHNKYLQNNSSIIPDLAFTHPRKQSLYEGVFVSRKQNGGMRKVRRGRRDNPLKGIDAGWSPILATETLLPGPCEKNRRKSSQKCWSLGNSSCPPLVKACPWGISFLSFLGCVSVSHPVVPLGTPLQSVWETLGQSAEMRGAAQPRCWLIIPVESWLSQLWLWILMLGSMWNRVQEVSSTAY